MPQKILVLGMINSIHFANWLERFDGKEIEFTIFPARQFRSIHPKIRCLLASAGKTKYSINSGIRPKHYSNILDYIYATKWFRYIPGFSRKNRLAKILKKSSYDVIHAVELQGAGYLLLEIKNILNQFPGKIILTNYGSDIYFYQNDTTNRQKLIDLLELATHYSAECQRDYELASDLGFKGSYLMKAPNSTAFNKEELSEAGVLTSQRSRVVVKTYGGTFGLGAVAIQAIEELLADNGDFNVTFYSVTDDLVDQIEILAGKYPARIEFFTVRNSLSHEELMQQFRDARVYLGCSRSDGISTSFLEALAFGCYPIQTNTSCAGEWVDLGAIASVIPTTKDAAVDALKLALADDELVNRAQKANLKIAQTFLSQEYIKKQLEHFYD